MPTTTADRLTAVKFALAAPRESTEVDILVATIHVLAHERPRDLDEMRQAVLDAWPGTSLDPARVDVAVDVAKHLGIVADRLTEAGDVLLHPVAEDPAVASSVEWTNQVIARTRAGIRDRVSRELMRALSDAEIDWWMNALLDAIGAGIREAFSAYQGDVTKPSNRWLIPTSYDRAAIRETIASLSPNDAVSRVLQALSTEAIDPSVEFGSGVVTYLATGYILHAFLARRDMGAAIETAGPLAGQKLILDTPVAYGLLDTAGPSQSLENVLEAAVQQQVQLVLPQQCVDEFLDGLRRAHESGEVEEIGRAVRSRADADLYRGLTGGIVSIWLSRWAATGKPESWEEFVTAAQEVLDDLRDRFGVNTIEFNRQGDPELRRLASDFSEEINSVLTERSPQGRPDRGSWQIANDGQTLAMLHLARERTRDAGQSSPWPGCWVMSPDTAIGPAFDRLYPDAEYSAVVTAAQLAHLLSSFLPPPSVKILAESAAQLLSHDTFVHVAGRFPPSTAVEMAEALRTSGEGHAVLDTRFAQLSLREIMEAREREEIDFGTALLRLQARRRSELAAMQVAETTETMNRYSVEIVNLTDRLESSEEERRELAEARAAIDAQRERSDQERAKLQEQLRQLEQTRRQEAADKEQQIARLAEEDGQRREQLNGAEGEIAQLQSKVDALAASLDEQRRASRRRKRIASWSATLLLALAASGGIWWTINGTIAATFAFLVSLWPIRKISEEVFHRHEQSWWPSVVGSAVVSGGFFLIQLLTGTGS